MQREGNAERGIADRRNAEKRRRLELLDAFINRDAGAVREQQDGGDEAPEIQLPRIAEGVPRIGRPLRLPDAEEQQDLMRDGHQRVDRFRQQRGRSSQRVRQDFSGRGDGIAAQSGRHDGLGRDRRHRLSLWLIDRLAALVRRLLLGNERAPPR